MMSGMHEPGDDLDGAALHEIATRTALGLPAAVETTPFGPDALVYKVVGKMFVLVGDVHGVPTITLKCAPPHGASLVAGYASITPGWHLNKQHWITIAPGAGIDEQLVEDLVGNAYDLVVAGLPRHKRPLDPVRRTLPD
jgi:predicted DNA-binding protein (MmcQ/YjbR family)